MRHNPASGRTLQIPAVHPLRCPCVLCRPAATLAGIARLARRLAFGRGQAAEAVATSIGLRAAGIALLLVPVRAIAAMLGGLL
ncbi:MAG TPA: hypothetical protein VF680_11545 [Allosphingosinicella sp.]|jgi:hypothetical protein